jgi:hypothetical protein
MAFSSRRFWMAPLRVFDETRFWTGLAVDEDGVSGDPHQVRFALEQRAIAW